MGKAGSSITPEHWTKAEKLEEEIAKKKGFSSYKKYARHRRSRVLSSEIDTRINARG
jgi:hypothetical protein